MLLIKDASVSRAASAYDVITWLAQPRSSSPLWITGKRLKHAARLLLRHSGSHPEKLCCGTGTLYAVHLEMGIWKKTLEDCSSVSLQQFNQNTRPKIENVKQAIKCLYHEWDCIKLQISSGNDLQEEIPTEGFAMPRQAFFRFHYSIGQSLVRQGAEQVDFSAQISTEMLKVQRNCSRDKHAALFLCNIWDEPKALFTCLYKSGRGTSLKPVDRLNFLLSPCLLQLKNQHGF